MTNDVPKKRRPGRPPGGQYHWTDWFALEKFLLRRCVHYDCTQSAMTQQIRTAACRRRLSVRIRDLVDRIEVQIRPNQTWKDAEAKRLLRLPSPETQP